MTHSLEGLKVDVSKRLLLINSASSLLAMVLNVSVLVWVQQYLLRRITPEEYSLLPVLSSVMMFAPLLTTVLTGGLSRYIVEACARGDEPRVIRIVSTMFPLLLLAGIGFVGLGFLLAWNIDSVLTIAPERVWDARIMLGLMVAGTALRIPLAVFGAGMYVRQQFVLSNVVLLAMQCLRLAILCAFLLGVSTRVLWVVVATVASDIVGLALTTALSLRLAPFIRYRWQGIDWRVARELTTFGAWNFVAALASTIRTSSDAIILNKLATPLDVANFNLGSLPKSWMQQTAHAVRAPLQPALTALYANDDRGSLANLHLRGGRYGLWAALALAIPLMVYSQELVELYVGGMYAEAAKVMVLLLAVYPLAFGNLLTPQIAGATGRIRPLAVIEIATQLSNLALTLYLVGRLKMGATGSALGTLVVSCVMHPMLVLPLSLSLTGLSFGRWWRDAARPGLVPGLAGAIVWWCARWLVHPDGLLSIAACTMAGAFVYGATLLTVGLRPSDRADLARILTRLRATRLGRVWARSSNR